MESFKYLLRGPVKSLEMSVLSFSGFGVLGDLGVSASS